MINDDGRGLDPEGVVRLLTAVLAGAPKLSDAGCRGRHALFDDRRSDEDVDDAEIRHAAAAAVCCRCPALDACAAWTARLRGRHRPGGVIAAQMPTPTRPRKETTA